MKTKHLRLIFIFIAAIILASSYAFLFSKTVFFSGPRLKSTDFFLDYRYKHSKVPSIIDKIVIVDIDETSLDKIQQRWPLSRDLYATFLKNISTPQSKPLAVAIDIAFIGKSDNPETDILLAQSIKESGNVILGAYFDRRDQLVMPEQMFVDSAKGLGCLNYPRDKDFFIRRARGFVYRQGKAECCLVLKTISLTQDLNTENYTFDKNKSLFTFIPHAITVKKLSLPFDPETNTTRINYLAKFKDFKVVPFWQTLEPVISPEIFKGKIVLLGTSTELLHDIYPTPLGLMPGLAINANFLMSVLLNSYLYELPSAINFLILFIVSFCIIFTTFRSSNIKGFIVSFCFAAIGLLVSVFCISKNLIFDYFGFISITVGTFIGSIIIKYLSILVENTRLGKLAVSDPLTGLYDKRYFDIKLGSEVRIASDLKTEVSLVFFEIDKLQSLNTELGYECGNEILKNVSGAIKRNSRPTDTVARDVGARVAVILAGTNYEGAGKYAEKIKKIVEVLDIVCGEVKLRVALKAGISSLTKTSSKSPKELVDLSLKMLQS